MINNVNVNKSTIHCSNANGSYYVSLDISNWIYGENGEGDYITSKPTAAGESYCERETYGGGDGGAPMQITAYNKSDV